jgi:hypothetical protein
MLTPYRASFDLIRSDHLEFVNSSHRSICKNSHDLCVFSHPFSRILVYIAELKGSFLCTPFALAYGCRKARSSSRRFFGGKVCSAHQRETIVCCWQ